jgi:hypothetical protein
MLDVPVWFMEGGDNLVRGFKFQTRHGRVLHEQRLCGNPEFTHDQWLCLRLSWPHATVSLPSLTTP